MAKPRVSIQVPVSLPAATLLNGQAVPQEKVLGTSGTKFYVIATSAPITIQAYSAAGISAANVFGTGQGQPFTDGFENLTVRNLNPFPVVALLWVGFDDFINDQLIIANTAFSNILLPTYSIPNTVPVVDILDKSGQTITDINGNTWGAVSRNSIVVYNLDGGVTLLLQKKNATTSNGPAVGAIYPLTPVQFECSGDYRLTLGGANLNCIVSEYYSCLRLAS